MLCGGCRSKIRRQRLNELGKAGISLGSNGLPVLLKSSPSDDDQSSERDADDVDVEVNTNSLVSTNDEEISEKVILKTENFDKFEDVVCFQPRTMTAALYTDNSIPVNSIHVSLDCLQSLNSGKDNENSNKNINNVEIRRNVLVQKISGENLLFEKEIESHFLNENRSITPRVQTGAEINCSHNNDTEKSSDILKNVLSTDGTHRKADENALEDLHVGSVITNSIEDQLLKPSSDFKADQISEISMSRSVERSDSNSNCSEKIHLQHDSNTQNRNDNSDEHVMKCHRISSFNELNGSVTAFRSDMSRSSDNSDNCAVVSLSDNEGGDDGDGVDDDSNIQSSDRDGESPPPSHDIPPIVLHNNHVYIAAVKPESRPMINLAIAIDDFPPPL